MKRIKFRTGFLLELLWRTLSSEGTFVGIVADRFEESADPLVNADTCRRGIPICEPYAIPPEQLELRNFVH